MNGILLVDKPEGWTSNDVVSKLKGVLHERRLGHSGTLDPLATGLLVVFAGRATRAVVFAEADDKRYTAGLKLGISTDTQDITGTVLESSTELPSREELEKAIKSFIGPIQQIPPMYSAIKVNGQRLYDLARKGETVERKARDITIHDIKLLSVEGDTVILDVHCSKGTYIRTLCHDIGEKLGCHGCMLSLRRTHAGLFDLADAHRLQDIIEAGPTAGDMLIPVDSLWSDCEKLTLSDAQEKKLRVGAQFKCRTDNGKYRVYSQDGEFLAVGEVVSNMFTTIRSFYEV